ncbi:hypothetical protein N9Z91_07705, partial [Akkermansiaceae bacterium]|nr:hypothetical protein [Akkermansiaceae bacterium]
DSLYPKKAMMMSGLSWVSHSSGVGIEPVPVWPEPQRSFALERGGWNFSAIKPSHRATEKLMDLGLEAIARS